MILNKEGDESRSGNDHESGPECATPTTASMMTYRLFVTYCYSSTPKMVGQMVIPLCLVAPSCGTVLSGQAYRGCCPMIHLELAEPTPAPGLAGGLLLFPFPAPGLGRSHDWLSPE